MNGERIFSALIASLLIASVFVGLSSLVVEGEENGIPEHLNFSNFESESDSYEPGSEDFVSGLD